VFPLPDSPATSVTRPPAAASPAVANQHADQAVESQVVASCDPVSGVESACAVQPEVDPKAARLQQLFQQLRIADKSPEEQKQWIAAQPSLELAKLVPNKEQRTLLSEFARGAPVGKKREPQVDSKPSDQSRESSMAASSAVSTPASSPGPTSSPALAFTPQFALSPASAPPARVDSFSLAPGIVPVTASAAASVSDQSASRLPPIALVLPAVERSASLRATVISGGDLLSSSASSLAPAEAADPPRAASTAADDSLEGRVAASAPSAASLAPAQAAAFNVLVSVFAAAGMVPSEDYPALAMKLISKGVAHQKGLNRKLQR